MALSFLVTTAGLLTMCVSTDLWHFWAAPMLYTLSFASGPVGSALVTDLVPREVLGRGLAVYNATTWQGGIVGCVLTGYAVQALGLTPTLIAGAFLPLLAVGLLAPVGRSTCAAEAADHGQPVPPLELLPSRA